MFDVYLDVDKVQNHMDAEHSTLWLRRYLDIELLSRGVYLKPENRYCLSLAHSEVGIEAMPERFEEPVDAPAMSKTR